MGAARVRVAHRDAVRVYVWQHLSAYPGSWFTAYELARAAARYADPDQPEGDRPPLTWRKPVLAVLRDMADAGEAECRQRVDEHATGAKRAEWRIAMAVRTPVLYPGPPARRYVASLPIPVYRPVVAAAQREGGGAS